MIVVDANAMIAALLDSEARGTNARAAMMADSGWIAPGHMPLEVMRTLRRYVVSGLATEIEVTKAIEALREAEITYLGMTDDLMKAVWNLRHNVSSYDAAYLVVAATYEATLVTADARLGKAAEQTMPTVEVLTL